MFEQIKPINLGIYIYDNAEVLDFSGPYEVFSVANRLTPNPLFNVFLFAEQDGLVSARGGYQIKAQYHFANVPQIDLLMVVGGLHHAELAKTSVLSFIAEKATLAKWVTSVCTGAFILAQAGVLTNQTVTTHWQDIEALRRSFPKLNVLEQQVWVEDGKYTTSAGISAGINMSLSLVAKIAGLKLAQQTARQMEYDWPEN